MADTKLKLDIQAAITSFATKPLHLSALSLFAVLGYQSDRTLNIESVQDFSKQFDPDGKLNHPIALKLKWQSVKLLFQLSDEELSRHTAFSRTSLKRSLHLPTSRNWVVIKCIVNHEAPTR